MKGKKGKLIYSIILIGIIGVLISKYFEFNSNPISMKKSKELFEEHIEKNYQGRDFVVSDVDFERQTRRYVGTVTSEKEGLEFFIERLSKDYVVDEYTMRDGFLRDDDIIYRFSKSIEDNIQANISKDLSEILEIYINMNIIQGKYRDRSIQFSKDLNEKFTVSATFKNNDVKTIDKAVEAMSEIAHYFSQNEHKGLFNIAISFTNGKEDNYIILGKNELDLSKDELKEKVKSGYLISFDEENMLKTKIFKNNGDFECFFENVTN